MKDQFVILYLPNPQDSLMVVSHGCYLAQMLSKGIILLYIEDKSFSGPSVEVASVQLESLERQMRLEHPDLSVSHVALKGKSREVVHRLPDLLSGVVAVAAVDANAPRRSPLHPRTVLHTFGECSIAYLLVQQTCSQGARFPHVAFSVDYNKESKEKLLWGSYYARFNHSSIHVLYEDYTDEGLRHSWHDNMLFLLKFFQNLGITFQPHPRKPQRALFPECLALDQAAQLGCDLFVAVTTDTRALDPLEWFVGTAEQRLVVNKHHLPVLFLNPRDDIYVLCD